MTLFSVPWEMTGACALFAAVYLIIVLEKVHKTLIVLLGASLVLLLKIIPHEEAIRHIDLNVIFLLLGMMLLVKTIERSGLFEYLAIWIAKKSRANPVYILINFFVATAFVSAFLDNVTTVLLIGPISILIAFQLGISPLPFLLTEVFASNLGGTATLVGDPPNILIGSAAGFTFNDFLANLAPVVLAQLAFFSLIIYLIFRKRLAVPQQLRARVMDMEERRMIKDKRQLAQSCLVLALVIIGFLFHGRLGVEADTIALTGAAILMLWTRIDVETVIKEVEWNTLLFFIGLFIMVGALDYTGFITFCARKIMALTGDSMRFTSHVVLWASGILSGVIDNIPLVATFIPILKTMSLTLGQAATIPVWYSLSLGACLGGNATMIGASANVVMMDMAKKNNITITFLTFLKYGIPFTLVSLLLSSLYVQFFLF